MVSDNLCRKHVGQRNTTVFDSSVLSGVLKHCGQIGFGISIITMGWFEIGFGFMNVFP